MAFSLHFVREGDFFVDVGANSGSYSILACAAVGANGVAFEPIPYTYTRLVNNMRLNYLDARVLCLQKGVSSHEDTIFFTVDGDTTNHALAQGEEDETKIPVEVTTLDIALRNRTPSLLKIDVEGYESLVLQGAPVTLGNKALHAVIMELNGSGERYGFDEAKILKLMEDYGFSTYSYQPFTRTLADLEGKNLSSGNTLFIRDKAYVDERLKTAPKINFPHKIFAEL